MHNGHSGNGHDATAVGRDLAARHRASRPGFRIAVLAAAVLFIVGVAGFVLKLADQGTDDPSAWGYYAALVAFLLTAGAGAVMVAIATRLAKAHWRRPISRVSEMFTVVVVYSFVLFIPLLFVLPDLSDHRRSLWFFGELHMPAYMPHWMALISFVFLAAAGLALLWVSALPDFALLRDSSGGGGIIARLANTWHGTSRQWFTQYHRLGILGALYFMMLVTTHFLFSMDFSMSIVPGWIDALYPATHAHNSLHAGVAIVLLTMFVLRRFGGYGDHIELDQFWGLGKLLFALSLLWFWFWFSSFIIFWYGAKPNEQGVLDLLMVGPYLWVFMGAFTLNFLVPLFTMIWNPLRKSIWGPTTIAVCVLVGTVLDRIRLYVASWSVADAEDKHLLNEVPAAVMPDAADMMMWVGGLAGAVLVYLLATRVVPVISIWEQKELLLYKLHKPFHRLEEVLVLGKKD
jgi:molybdopterin-containing oxidoreductase family membrane subunit